MLLRAYFGLAFKFACIIAILTVFFPGLGSADEAEAEKAAIISEARAYFEAELSGDTKAIWNALAPSSVFKRQYSYDDYVAIQSKADLAVKDYDVVEVSEVMENNDTTVLPGVEKLAAVKVRVRLKSKDGKESEHNNIFIFLKENGKWLKG